MADQNRGDKVRPSDSGWSIIIFGFIEEPLRRDIGCNGIDTGFVKCLFIEIKLIECGRVLRIAGLGEGHRNTLRPVGAVAGLPSMWNEPGFKKLHAF